MSVRIGINGFGRIGRLVARALYEYDRKDVELVAINSPGDLATQAHLLKYDSMHGNLGRDVAFDEGWMDFGIGRVRVTHERNPANIDWGAVGADIVLECTGVFRTKEKVQGHFDAGAKKVLISAPAQGVDRTIVYGVNDDEIKPDWTVLSCASCTTNCLAPIAKVLMDSVGIKSGFMTTIHSMTLDQQILDSTHQDMYRARTASQNMIPTSTGAAKTVEIVIPELKGRLHGSAVRVPTANVSMVDLAFVSTRPETPEHINAVMKAAADHEMKGVIRYTEEPLVSSDLNHDPHSAIFAAPLTKTMGDNLIKVIAWYDNEWGFANRMIDVAKRMGDLT